MVQDGKIVSIRKFVKSKYKGRYKNAATALSADEAIEKEIKELQNKSIAKTAKLENGKLVIPGLDMNNIDEIQRVSSLSKRLAREASGGMSDGDVNKMSMSIWTRSMMVFKNWIPKLVDTRFGEFRRISDDFSVTIDENGMSEGDQYDIGRLRLFFGMLIDTFTKSEQNILNVMFLNDKGVMQLDKM